MLSANEKFIQTDFNVSKQWYRYMFIHKQETQHKHRNSQLFVVIPLIFFLFCCVLSGIEINIKHKYMMFLLLFVKENEVFEFRTHKQTFLFKRMIMNIYLCNIFLCPSSFFFFQFLHLPLFQFLRWFIILGFSSSTFLSYNWT